MQYVNAEFTLQKFTGGTFTCRSVNMNDEARFDISAKEF